MNLVHNQSSKSQFSLPPLGLGSAVIGGLFGKIEDAKAINTIRSCINLGINFFDTAPRYGLGKCEELIGVALQDIPRSQYIISTKVGYTFEKQESAGWKKDLKHMEHGFSYDKIMASVEGSLKRLKTDYLDIVLLHDPDNNPVTVIHEGCRTLWNLREQKIVKHIGVGTTQAEVLLEILKRCNLDCSLIAGQYTLLNQKDSLPLLNYCLKNNICIVAGGVFNSGILGKGISKNAKFNYHKPPPHIIEKVRYMEEIANKWGIPLKAASLQFCHAHPAIKSILIGSSSVLNLKDNLESLSIKIPYGFWQELKKKKIIASTCPLP